MKIYLVRHGESAHAGEDNKRSLSEQGKKEIEFIANFISPLNLHVSRAFQSEKLRAQQTATILATRFKIEEPIEIRPELDPSSPVDIIINDLYAEGKDTLLVGHMPFMGKLAAKLVTGNENHNILFFKPGSMVCLEQIEYRQWVIDWMINPELFS